MDLILGLVFFLSLMFLAMIFGERLSLFGVVDGRWMTAPFDLASYFWNMVCEATDRIWCFVFDHVWWVTATVAGAVGILLVALILVSGLSNEARAVRQDERAVMNTGSVLDSIPELNTKDILQTKFTAESDKVAQLIHQIPTPTDRFWAPPVIQQPVISELSARPQTPTYDRYPATNVPPLEVEPWDFREPIYPAGRLSISIEPFLERIGHRVRSDRLDELIQQTVLTLRDDQWRTFSDTLGMSRNSALRPPLREDSALAVEDLYSRVRVINGDLVSSNNLKVEKTAPAVNSSGSFEIQIRVTNLGRNRISGIIVRELLPAAGTVRNMAPRGVYRDGIVTWLLDVLDPMQDAILTLQVATTNAQNFLSYTEVSATSAVSTQSRIGPRDRPLPPVEEPEFKLPDVQLTFENPPSNVAVDEWVDVFFQVKNVGNAPAEGVLLRVDLPFGLDHRLLRDEDTDRRVDSSVRRLEVGESRQMKLTVRATSPGRHFAAAELALQDTQLDMQSFEIVASDASNEEVPRITPRPDFR